MTRPHTGNETAQWFLRRGGGSQKTGPINKKQLSELWHDGLLSPDDLLFAEGILPDWIRVGKLQNFLSDYTSGWRKARPADSRAVQIADSPQKIFLIDNGHRRGPIDVDQLRSLVSLATIESSTDVLDASGERCTTVGEFLETGTCPKPTRSPLPKREPAQDRRPQRADPKPAPAANGSSDVAERPARQRPRPAPPPRRTAPPPRPPKQKAPGRASQSGNRKQPKLTPTPSDTGTHRADSTVDEAPLVRSSSRSKRPDEQQPDRALQRLPRRANYARATTLWSGILLVQALVVLTVTNALFGMFLRRMGGLCLSTFIPFTSTPEELKQEALLLAGVATVLVGLAMVFPLWHLLRTDSIPWHTIAAIVIGFCLGMLIRPPAVPPLMLVTRIALVMGGIGLAATCFWLMITANNAKVSSALLVPLGITIVCIGGFAVCDSRQLFDITLDSLPPRISGKMPHTAVFLVCLYTSTMAFPAFCYYALSGQVSESVKRFMDAHLFLAAIAGIGMIGFAYCLFQPQQDQFMSIPLALAPVAAVNAVVSMAPPAMWMTHPENIGLR